MDKNNLENPVARSTAFEVEIRSSATCFPLWLWPRVLKRLAVLCQCDDLHTIYSSSV